MKNSRKSEIFIRYNSLQKEEEGERLSKKRDTWIIPIITEKPKVFLIAQRVWITICVGFCQVFCVWSNDGFLVRHAMSGSELLANIFFFFCSWPHLHVCKCSSRQAWTEQHMNDIIFFNQQLSGSMAKALIWVKGGGDRDRKVKILIWNEDSN